ncbi:MAG: Asp23/Gls24 family envelope stress response protein [Evtepia gabavorous]
MSESREYYSRSEPYGDVYISEEVLEMIAGAAALEVEGVTGLAGGTMSEQLLGRKKLSKGITILWESDNITINVSIQIRYGGTIPEVAERYRRPLSPAWKTPAAQGGCCQYPCGRRDLRKPEA